MLSTKFLGSLAGEQTRIKAFGPLTYISESLPQSKSERLHQETAARQSDQAPPSGGSSIGITGSNWSDMARGLRFPCCSAFDSAP